MSSPTSALTIKVFNPGAAAIFPVTSTIVYGETEAMLIDAQFQKQYAQQLVDEIKKLGKTLTTVYISHSDPDYYFALDVIKANFPNARIISTAQTAYLIEASKDDKLTVWTPQLAADAPSELIAPEAVTSIPDLEGNKIEIIRTPQDPAHSFLWIPALQTILGGISVSVGSHLWMADTKDETAIDNWIAQIDRMKTLMPAQVIPSHFIESDYSLHALDFVKSYLENYKQATRSKDAADIIAFMEKQYPDLPGKESLVMGAKVFTGAMNWDLKLPYPAIGNQVTVNFGGTIFELTFADNRHMSFIGTEGAFVGVKDSVDYKAVEVASNVFMVYWHEPKSGSNVVHVQDYNTNTVYTNIAATDGTFTHLKGTLSVHQPQ